MSEKKQRFLEALLFASEGILSRAKIKRFMSLNDAQLDRLVLALQEKYGKTNSSFRISTTNTSVMLTVEDEFVPKIKNFLEAEFSSALLKTLALVAYRSPITQSDVIKARGNKGYGHVNELVSLGLLQAESYGKTKMLRLTPKFFKYFNVTEKQLQQTLKTVPQAEERTLGQKKTMEEAPETPKAPQQQKPALEPSKSVQEGDRETANEFFSG